MKLVRALTVCSWIGALFAAGCSDPPSEPPEGAVEITVDSAGSSCQLSHSTLDMPNDTRVGARLSCDLTTGCKPGEFVGVDGDTDTSVSCRVVDNSPAYVINATMSYKGNSFGISGSLSNIGGTATINHYSSERRVNGSGSCTIDIIPNKGTVSGGKVWATFTCPDFRDPSTANNDKCAASGKFLFQKCDGG